MSYTCIRADCAYLLNLIGRGLDVGPINGMSDCLTD